MTFGLRLQLSPGLQPASLQMYLASLHNHVNQFFKTNPYLCIHTHTSHTHTLLVLFLCRNPIQTQNQCGLQRTGGFLPNPGMLTLGAQTHPSTPCPKKTLLKDYHLEDSNSISHSSGSPEFSWCSLIP